MQLSETEQVAAITPSIGHTQSYAMTLGAPAASVGRETAVTYIIQHSDNTPCARERHIYPKIVPPLSPTTYIRKKFLSKTHAMPISSMKKFLTSWFL